MGQFVSVGALVVGLATHATPALRGESLTEGYLTQPAIALDAGYGPLQLNAMLNLEGWTLDRGELNAGVWGEGYMDRRHPHTFLHEAMISAQATLSGTALSLSAGRGFAPYGTDDPMVRPIVKYPTNHHLSQILERPVASAALRRGPLILEGGLFAGAEPANPEDLGDLDKFGDSWSARVTLVPRGGVELQGSYAEVTSPENPFGGGLDHELWNASARLARRIGDVELYGLLEVGEMSEGRNGLQVYFFKTLLAEGALRRRDWQIAARFERSQRPEEERQLDWFRSVRPATDDMIVGVTRFTAGTVQLSRSTRYRQLGLQPFIEVARIHAQAMEEFPVLPPENLFGSSRMWSFSAGIRSTIGSWHTRMGRYGAARIHSEHQH